ncbi:Uma2 family endonuclease [Mobilicoccus massiliensis]|uniref:Uma2 family endonuclease n=1 Tax=Mobilicoccus massiliensis TaxID=1522310 RepID=UPI00069492AC|nr:Uma2 family endonuclease [Mobilicoccus massiliensis]
MTVTHDPVDELVLPRFMTFEQWTRLDAERPVELVEGVPVVSPFEPLAHLGAAGRLGRLIEDASNRRLSTLPGVPVDVTVDGERPTVRIPDLVVFEGELTESAAVMAASRALLVAEVVSRTSVERDWVAKRAEYAAAGIPRYLIVDGLTGRLALFDEIVDGRYADPRTDADSVTLVLDDASLTLTLDDLL